MEREPRTLVVGTQKEEPEFGSVQRRVDVWIYHSPSYTVAVEEYPISIPTV